MKETSIEWLYNEFCQVDEGIRLTDKTAKKIIDLFEQAKEMEKQQIIEAMDRMSNTDFYCEFDSPEQYYNETYNND